MVSQTVVTVDTFTPSCGDGGAGMTRQRGIGVHATARGGIEMSLGALEIDVMMVNEKWFGKK